MPIVTEEIEHLGDTKKSRSEIKRHVRVRTLISCIMTFQKERVLTVKKKRRKEEKDKKIKHKRSEYSVLHSPSIFLDLR